MPEAKSPVIELPDNPELVEKLRLKLGEYKRRLRDREPHEHPDLYIQRMMDTCCKIAVLEQLINTGRVVAWDLSLKLRVELDITPKTAPEVASTFARALINACGVIADYCKTGGANAHGGTGLK